VAAAVVGVPEISPLDARASPVGNAPAVRLQLSGAVPPVAARVAE